MKYLFSVLLLFLCLNIFGQTNFGNEWIVNGQTYYKINITEKGVYRITYAQLQAAGFFSTAVNPQKIQLFFRGNEVPLYVNGQDDGNFDASDYIEFYGTNNDGGLDVPLYNTTSWQPNTEVSLFSDQASYFLTVGTPNGKRYTSPTINNTQLTPETYLLYTASENFTDSYYPGRYILDAMSLSEYIEGEGYMGPLYSIGSSQNRTISTPNAINIANVLPTIDYYVAGRSDASSADAQARNHHFRLTVNNATIADYLFKGYAVVRDSKTIASNLGTTTSVNFSSVDDLGAQTDFQAPAYARITYPRSFDASSYNALNFSVAGTSQENNLSFTNVNWTDAFILDPTNNYRYPGTKLGNSYTFNVKNPAGNKLFVFDGSAVKTPSLSRITLSPIVATATNADFLIVTHQSLISAATDYASYKTSKGFKPLVVTTEDLYNQFSFGVHHPIAIKNFVAYLLAKATIKPAYLLLAGKGYEMPKYNLANDLVPTMGYPASDTFLTSGIVDNTATAALPTGRIPAKTNNELNIYLNKLKAYDELPDSLWRKNIINITGGKDIGENNLFSTYLKNLNQVSASIPFGSKGIYYDKNVTSSVTTDLIESITKSVNKGAQLVNYLGHGSSTITSVSIGNPSTLTNNKKLLFYLINGCSTGNAFTSGSLGESYILQPEKGAIGWLGTSSEGVASYLFNYSNLFFKDTFTNNPGASVAKSMQQAQKTYQNPNDVLNMAHTRQYIYLGDPSISFYAPQKADFEVDNKSIWLADNTITANVAGFDVKVVVNNIAKATSAMLDISVQRTLPDNTVINYPVKSYQSPLNSDTLTITIDNAITNAAGNNKLKISVDPSNKIEELNESNNTAEFSFLLASNGLSIIAPQNFGIAGTAPTLTVQSNNLRISGNTYVFEIDTLNTFSTPFKTTSPNISAGVMASWTPSVSLENNKVYYWRAKMVTNAGNDAWQQASFTYIAGSGPGWSQAHRQQLVGATLTGLELDVPTGDYSFAKGSFPVQIKTRGNDANNSSERKIRASPTLGATSFDGSEFYGMAILAMDPNTPESKSLIYPSPYFRGSYTYGTYYYDTNEPVALDSLLSYLKKIPQGYLVVGMSGINFNPNALPTAIKAEFTALGLTKMFTINNGEPYGFWTKKGNTAVTIEEAADYSSNIPPSQQNIDYVHGFPVPNISNGQYQSERVGPATKWENTSFNLQKNSNDAVSYNIIGVNTAGTEVTLKQNLTAGTNINLNDIDAKDYPYLSLKVNVSDPTDKTSAMLKSWNVVYQGIPDISFNGDIANKFYSETLQEGDTVKVEIGLANLEKIVSDTVLVNYRLTKSDNSVLSGLITKIDPITNTNDQTIKFSLPTLGLRNNNNLQLTAIPKDGLDKIQLNNYVSYNFTVESDKKAPILDVLFDNKRIINGEIVSPTPRIQIAVSDENKFITLKDTTSLEVYIKSATEAEYKRVSFSSNKLNLVAAGTSSNNKADFAYTPDNLTDGTYSLKLRSKDATGNYIQSADYVISFEVVNEQAITNFLPYPNPFTTSMRFVFQVTGKIPDDIKVQIMTVSGKIVREVFKNELGNIKIGNNISDFSWDGTDQYGDRLANGVYFYQVKTKNNDDSETKHRTSTADQYFKKNFGKIYLMR